MNTNEVHAADTVNRIRGALGAHVLSYEVKSARRMYIDIAPETVGEAGSLMFEEIGARLQIATGVDTRRGIEVMYHWALDEEDCVVTIRTLVDHENPELESIATLCPAAEWIEREIWELLGVEFRDHPDLRHLLLDDSWPEGNYPLRHDYRRQGRLAHSSTNPNSAVRAGLAGDGASQPSTNPKSAVRAGLAGDGGDDHD
jgi:Ni,Fe-hydrogenase III component G